MKHFLLTLLLTLSFVSFISAQVTILDDFETGAGHFNLATNYSGSTTGIIATTPTIDTTTAALGSKSLRIVLISDTASHVPMAVRFLSGMGAPASNVNMAPTGFTGYWLKTNRAWLQTAPCIDAPGTGEIGDTTEVIGDNQWHLYQWNLGVNGKPYWNAFATGNDTISDDATPTYDAIFFWAPYGSDTTVVYLDYVAWNASGELPVELVSFSASAVNNSVDLKWITSTEINNRGFEVERRLGNSAYSVVGFVKGKGTATEITPYTFTDRVYGAGKYFYRLKQIDFNGTFEYSDEVMVDVIAMPGQYGLAQNYPNPFNPSTTIQFEIPKDGFVSLSVYNLLGEKVADLLNEEMQSGNHSVTFDAGKLSSGTYIYSLKVNGNTFTKKMSFVK